MESEKKLDRNDSEKQYSEGQDSRRRDQPPLGIVQRRRLGLQQQQHQQPLQLHQLTTEKTPSPPLYPTGVESARAFFPSHIASSAGPDEELVQEISPSAVKEKKTEDKEKKDAIQHGHPFDITQWFSELELRFRDVVSECAEQLTEKHEYFQDGQSGYKWDRFMGFFTPVSNTTTTDEKSVRKSSTHSSGDVTAAYSGGADARRPSIPTSSSTVGGYPLAGNNPAGFAAFAFSHALFETGSTEQSDSIDRMNQSLQMMPRGSVSSSPDVGTEFNLRAASLGLSADCLLRNYYSSKFMTHQGHAINNDSNAGSNEGQQGLQQTALNYWRLIKASLTNATTSTASQQSAEAPGVDKARYRRHSSSTSTSPVGGGYFVRSNSAGNTGSNAILEAFERGCSDRLAVWFSSHELVGVFNRNHPLFGRLLALQYEARTRMALSAKMEQEVMDRDGLRKLTLSTYLDIMRLGPIFAGFEYPIFGTFLLSQSTSHTSVELSPIEEANLRQLLRDIGEYLVIRQQYCDVFGEGRLIRNGRLSWPLAVAVGQADEDQLAALATFYGSGTSSRQLESMRAATGSTSSFGPGPTPMLPQMVDDDDDGVFYTYRQGSTCVVPDNQQQQTPAALPTPSLAPAYVARVRRVLRDIGVPEKFREWERAARAHSLAEIRSAKYLDPHVTHALEIFFEEPFLAMTNCHFQSMAALMAARMYTSDC